MRKPVYDAPATEVGVVPDAPLAPEVQAIHESRPYADAYAIARLLAVEELRDWLAAPVMRVERVSCGGFRWIL